MPTDFDNAPIDPEYSDAATELNDWLSAVAVMQRHLQNAGRMNRNNARLNTFTCKVHLAYLRDYLNGLLPPAK